MEEERFEQTLGLRRINRWLVGLALGPALLGAYLAAVEGSFSPLGALAALSVIGVGWVIAKNPVPSHAERIVKVEPRFLRVGDTTVPRATIRDARLIPTSSEKLFVRVLRGGLPVDLDVRDRAEGRRFLRALGFDASQTVARFWGAWGPVTLWGRRAGFAALGIPFLFFVLSTLFLESAPGLWAIGMKMVFVLSLAVVAAFMTPSRIHVGADGVLIRWLGFRRFLPLAEIRTVERATSGFPDRQVGARFAMADGSELWVPIGNPRWSDDLAATLVERVHEAMETHAHGSVEADAALLVRRDRDVHTWIQELRAIGAGANADLRTAPVNPEHLWRVVESHTAPPEARAAAAVALGPRLDEEGKQRLRVAVDAVADERLRVAINAAATSDTEEDAALEEALGEVSSRARH